MAGNKPLLVGITGGIGSGKSIVCKIFQTLGIPVYDADSKARWLMENDSELQGQIMKEFGEQSYVNGILQREYLGKLVFPFPDKLKILNSLTHPAVGKNFEKWVSENNNFPYLIKESALFIEAGSYKSLDRLVLVTAPDEVRISRVLKRDLFRSNEDVKTIIKRQLSDEDKRKYCQYEIVNDGNISILEQVLNMDNEFRNA